jgi:preprotein translocase subunit SecF
LAQLREKEPAMQALAKRVEARSSSSSSTSTVAAGSVAVANGRGPRNQPKRKGRK